MSDNKKKLATLSLAGCFGCHMSFLDMDLKLLDLFDHVELVTSPLTDFKNLNEKVDIGLIEGGICNDENVENLINYRTHCKTLVSLGECAIMGGLPALRNNIPLSECLNEAYIQTPTTRDLKEALIPFHKEIPEILDKVYPCHEVVKIDHFIPGCPPSGEAIYEFLMALVKNKEPQLEYKMLKYD